MEATPLFITVLYGLIGATGALSVVVFVWGISLYIARLGTERRADGIDMMEWSVGLGVTVIILIGLLRLVESHFLL